MFKESRCRSRSLRRSVVLAALLGAVPAIAHDPAPQPDCVAPVRPADKIDVERWNAFVDAVDVYRACMNAFIQANHAAADAHRGAANAATDSWNAFVRSSLNAPEDYPWPPP